ncbi:response regulator transcription factor [Streptomyces sp. 13-12-16]|uniref:helix-turn-helix transcriptional regulator n=1 Tax=Streptomyces sp. 13-12-16 TaxID=1570823 RepID=UPI00117CFF4F|nr:response regulator transcription factor [Streptomyces sp. 13-12-16]
MSSRKMSGKTQKPHEDRRAQGRLRLAGEDRAAERIPVQDVVEDALLGVRRLIDETLAQLRDRTGDEQFVRPVEDGADGIVRKARQLSAGAAERTEVLLAAPPAKAAGSPFAPLDLLTGPTGLRRARRLLCTADLIDVNALASLRQTLPSLSVRLASRLPPVMMMTVDDHSALVAVWSSTTPTASVVRSPEAVLVLREYFGAVWHTAVPAELQVAVESHPRAALTRQIIDLLCTGAADDVAARKLSISVRTYRRHVAEIMALVGANSRFQAGVKAARIGSLGLASKRRHPSVKYRAS